ncbi:MAG TPA: lytic murein transglycosylase [Solirubrobacteraceae bacterium]|nr:lytic murein transglycosylase [Solirubrobacteraceae bacterium]
MTAPSGMRKWAWRAFVSAIAGGAAVGPLSGNALAAENWSGSEPEGTGTTPTETTPSEKPTTTSTTPTTTTSTPTASTPAPAPTTSSTASTPPPTTTDSSETASAEVKAPKRPTPKSPAVVLQRRQKGSEAKPSETGNSNQTTTTATPNAANAPANDNVAIPPQLIAAQEEALAAQLAGSAASTQALSFYRIPLFLLPIYQAASVQYGVPWQILAAINEIETNYGTDQSVSTAGAVGWMQFMPSTWIQYGVDALNAGYADPYNPVDAIFAAARYLRAAGSATDLHGAILAYNHSEDYVKSVLLRAKLISSYPKGVIATLTGLTDGRLPVSGKQVAWGSLSAAPSPSSVASGSSATASATQVASDSAAHLSAPTSAAGTPGSSAAPAPSAAAASAGKHAKHPPALQLVDLMSAPGASVVAAQDGRVVKLGSSRKLGKYLILRDVYGDVFTYAGLGSIATHYAKPKAPKLPQVSGTESSALPAVAEAGEAKPTQPASAGHHAPVTLKVKIPAKHGKAASSGGATVANASEPAAPATGKVRLFAHPGNPDALASAARHKRTNAVGHQLPLRAGSIVSIGTVLGKVRTPAGARSGHLRFAIRPGGDQGTVDPRPILQNWAQLSAALHPQGAGQETDLLGATASGVFLMSKDELERAVLSDPGINIYECGRQDIASGKIDKRVLAVLAFLSRTGLKPTVSALECGHSEITVSGYVSEHYTGDAVDISAINGIPIAGHQGPGTITDLTIRTLLTLQGEFVPHQIISLMQYPGAANTLAMPEHWNHIHVGFHPTSAETLGPKAAQAARAAGAAKATPVPVIASSDLSATQWDQLVGRIGSLPQPKVAGKRSSAAIKDPTKPKGSAGSGH